MSNYISLVVRCIILDSSHTRTAVRECYKGDDASQLRSPKFAAPHQAQTP